MAHKNVDYKPEDIQFPNQKIVQSELVHEMQSSYIEYAMSVIVGRALPDVRDGLKPVHRRILYAMYEDGLTSDKAFKKSATCVGDVLGRYHPHGDASVYDALVRLAQDFSMRYMLVDGHGNFGSIDGDPPAAYRYTEARMSKIANEMLRDIDKETVDWDPNFDESRKEPRVLPARFPNLLVNGSSGIAVGMATNIPPHNLREIIEAPAAQIDNPDISLDELMKLYLKKVKDNSANMLERLNADLAHEQEDISETERTAENLETLLLDAQEELKATKRQRIRDLMKHPEQEELLSETYDELEHDLIQRINGLQNQLQMVADKRNTIIQVNRAAKTAMEVFDDLLSKEHLDRKDLQLIIEKIKVYEDHLEIQLKADIDCRMRRTSLPPWPVRGTP